MDATSNRTELPKLERWLSGEEIAERLGASHDSIYPCAKRRKMPADKVGQQWKFWVKSEQTQGSQPASTKESEH